MTTADDSPLGDYASFLRLDDRGFVVVGAGQGMGRQTAHALASLGAHVLCVDIDAMLAKEVADEVGGVACVADVRKSEDAQRTVATARDTLLTPKDRVALLRKRSRRFPMILAGVGNAREGQPDIEHEVQPLSQDLIYRGLGEPDCE
jgi:NAD(P)-dependent dehydrogenase (short-subunit alcohol dehydrogenase family)